MGTRVVQDGPAQAFVSQRERGFVRQLEIVPTSAGLLTYREIRTFLFLTSLTLENENGRGRS